MRRRSALVRTSDPSLAPRQGRPMTTPLVPPVVGSSSGRRSPFRATVLLLRTSARRRVALILPLVVAIGIWPHSPAADAPPATGPGGAPLRQGDRIAWVGSSSTR